MRKSISFLLLLALLIVLSSCLKPLASGTAETTDKATENVTENSDFPYPITDAELLKQVKKGMRLDQVINLFGHIGTYTTGEFSQVTYTCSDGNNLVITYSWDEEQSTYIVTHFTKGAIA